MLRPLIYVWPYALAFWAVFAWVFAPEFSIVSRKDEPSSTTQDAHSKRVIGIGQGLAMMSAFVIAMKIPSAGLPDRVVWFWVGLCTMVAGSLLRRHCWRMLGSSFTGAVIVKAGQAVVQRGAYRYVRHPSYTAGAMLFVGIALALANWVSLVVLLTAVIAVYAYRVHVEERALLAVIGEPYLDYMRHTTRFVPFLF